MAISLDHGYVPVQKKLDELAKTNPIRSVLDLGCGPTAPYVEWLLDHGYDAYGIDVEFNPLLPTRVSERLYTGELTDLGQIFGDRSFDLMTSRAVLTVHSILPHLLGKNWLMNCALIDRSPQLTQEVTDLSVKTIEDILQSAFNQLNPGGFLISCENLGKMDKVDFSMEAAQRIGYHVLEYGLKEAVLQKPR